jgi:hypothetical protein
VNAVFEVEQARGSDLSRAQALLRRYDFAGRASDELEVASFSSMAFVTKSMTDVSVRTQWSFRSRWSAFGIRVASCTQTSSVFAIALATLARYHADSQLGRDAREQLKSLDPAAGQDPLPMLVARIDAMRTQADREKVPAPVSAYSDRPGMPTGRGY